MAFIVLKNAYVMINAVDLSDHVKQVTLKYSAVIHDDTAMGATSKSRIAGLLDWSMDVEFYQDYASGKVDATLFPLVGAAAFAVHLKPVNDTISTTNPDFTGNAVIEGDYTPVSGAVGDLSTVTVTFAGDGALTRDVEP
jgi:hypothetical protein